MMIQKLEDVTTLKSFFGEEMVDAFIGLPKDPLTLGKREVLQNEIKNAEEAYKRKKAIIEALLDSEHNVIQNEYEFQAEPIRAKIQELQETIRKLLDERDKKRFEAESKAETEIKLAKDELDTKRIELRRKLGETVGNC
jgi:DNA repair exonuclease SbcCD ATPase subunit